MKFLHTSDWHIGRSLPGQSRELPARLVTAGMRCTPDVPGICLAWTCGARERGPAPASTPGTWS